MSNYIKHHGIKGQKWGVRRFQNKNGSFTAAGKKRYNDDEYDEEREAYEKEAAARSGVKYVRKTKKEREAEDAENERKFNARLEKDTAAQKRTEDKMKEIDKKLQAKYDLSSMEDLDKYYKEYDEAWFEILAEERKKEGLAHADLFTLDELYHHGIKGMKWNVRRFQNKDGSLTPAGKKRYNKDATWDGPLPKLGELAKMKKEDPARYSQYKAYEKAQGFDKQAKQHSKDAQKAVKNAGKDNKNFDAENLGKSLESAKNLYDQYGDTARTMAKNQATKEARDKIKYDLSQMSDSELKNIVNRLNMEERYTQVMMSRHAETGKSFAEKLIDGAGTALVLGTSALALAEQMKKLKDK